MKLPRFTRSLLFRLILIGVTLVLVGSGVRFYVLTNFIREDITSVVAQQQSALANYVARDIGHQILLRKSRLKELANAFANRDAETATNTHLELEALAAFDNLFPAGLLLTNTNGKTLAATTALHGLDTTSAVVKLKNGINTTQETTFIGRPLKVSGEGVAVLPISVALKLPGQEPWGFLTGFSYLYSPDFLGNLLKVRLGSTGSGFLLISPSEKLFVAASNPAKVLTETPPEGVNPLHDRAMQGYRGTGITINAHGVEEISAMASVPNTNWFVVSAIATSEALGTVERVKTYLLKNTVVAVVLLLIVLTTLVTLLLYPLTRATRMADDMSRGVRPLAPLPGTNDGEIGVLIGAFNRLLNKLDRQQNELRNAANHDTLTGLPNRRLLTERLAQALQTARDTKAALALVFVDLDQFKPINDTLGHEAGDRVLGMVAQRLVNHVRKADCVARLGGDEFVILLTNLSKESAMVDAQNIINGLVQAVSESPYDVAGSQCSLGISTGAVISDGTHTPSNLMHWADKLMYQAKTDGGSRSIICNADEMTRLS